MDKNNRTANKRQRENTRQQKMHKCMYAYYNQNVYTDNLRLATNNAHVHSVFDVQEIGK